MSDLYQRLQNLLFLVPYVVRHRGVLLTQLASMLGLSKEKLMEEIDFLLMVGRPPFQPNDFLDIYYEEDKVYADLHQSLSRPPRLNVFEALGLASAVKGFAAGHAQDQDHEGVAERVLDKILSVLPDETRMLFERFAGSYLIVSNEGLSQTLQMLDRAVESGQELEIDYYTAGRADTTTRTIRPLGLACRSGVWYLAAFCKQRQTNRLFRVSRIRRCTQTPGRFERSQDFDLDRFVDASLTIPKQGERKCVIRFRPEQARQVRERWPGEYLREETDGCLLMILHDVSEEWLMSYVASFAGEAVIIEPNELSEKIGRQALSVISKYQDTKSAR